MEAMAQDLVLDFKLYKQNAKLYEQTVLKSDQAAAEEETTSKKTWLLEMVGMKGPSTKTRYEPDTTQWKVTVDDSTSEVPKSCEKDDSFTTTGYAK